MSSVGGWGGGRGGGGGGGLGGGGRLGGGGGGGGGLGFWRPGSDRSTVSDGGSSVYLVNNKHTHLPIHQQRQLLPIYEHRSKILYALERYQALILVGETGSGKYIYMF